MAGFKIRFEWFSEIGRPTDLEKRAAEFFGQPGSGKVKLDDSSCSSQPFISWVALSFLVVAPQCLHHHLALLYHAFNYIQIIYSESISHWQLVPPCSDPVPPSTNHYRPILIQYHPPLPPETNPAPPSTNQHSFFQIQRSDFPSLSPWDERSCTLV